MMGRPFTSNASSDELSIVLVRDDSFERRSERVFVSEMALLVLGAMRRRMG